MSAMTAAGADNDDLLPAHVAARVSCYSSKTLARKADAGELRAFKRPGKKGRFYSRREIDALRPKAAG